jgi:FMN-dependent oxidoreductase (nitrilotriacetate monooxygenase family)
VSRDKNKRMLHLNLFLNGLGHHEAAWRHPGVRPELLADVRYYQRLARRAEHAKFDSIFLADRVATSAEAAQWGGVPGFEPLTLLAALAVSTERIGLIGTVSTTFNDPFNLARRFASLDHISRGRAGWNIVTSGTDQEAQNFGYETIPGHYERYERAKEFVEVANKLWDSWDRDALVLDKRTGVFADREKVHEICHRGRFYSVRGPLNIPPSPQRRPVLVQAGSSEDGKDFAAAYAEAIFTAQQTLQEAQAFYADVKARAERIGRDPDSIKILPGICPIIGQTEAQAKEKEAQLHNLINPEYSLLKLSDRIGVDLTGCSLDGPLPELPPVEQIEGHRSRTQLILKLADRERLTIRQLLLRLAGGRGHLTVAGTPKQVADLLEEWLTEGAADGFNIMPQLMEEGLNDFVDHVVPELQRRGLFRTEYSGATLRDHYGLTKP